MSALPNFTNELARLLEFAAEVAWVARLYSGFVPGGRAGEAFQGSQGDVGRAGADLMHLMSVLCALKDVGSVIDGCNADAIRQACAAAMAAFDTFQFSAPGPGCYGVSTYEVWRDALHLERARAAVLAVQVSCKHGAGAQG